MVKKRTCKTLSDIKLPGVVELSDSDDDEEMLREYLNHLFS